MRKARTTTSLISAVMILVLTVVALSTATYAWFSADNVVNLSTIEFTVKHDTSGDGELRVLWDTNEYDKVFGITGTAVYGPPIPKDKIHTPEAKAILEGLTSLDARALSMNIQGGGWDVVAPERESDRAVLSPAMPSIAPYKGMPTYEFYDMLYSSNTSYRIEDGKIVEYYYSEPNQDNVIAVLARGNVDYTSYEGFYLYNVNEVFGQRVTLSFTIADADYKDALRCAVFVEGGLVGIMGESNRIYYGPIVKGANIEDNLNYVSGDLDYDSADPNADPTKKPNDSLVGGTRTIAPFTFDVYDCAYVMMYFYLDGNYINNDVYDYAFEIEKFELIGEFIERPTGDTNP